MGLLRTKLNMNFHLKECTKLWHKGTVVRINWELYNEPCKEEASDVPELRAQR